MTGDLQLFMLWNNGRRLEKQILADIGSRYEIAGICEVFWPPRHFARNLARFYGKNLRKGAKKNQRMRNRTFSCHRCPRPGAAIL